MDIFKQRRTPLRVKMPKPGGIARLQAKQRARSAVNREIERIVGLPLIAPVTPEEVEEFCRTNTLAEAYGSGWRLFDCQVGAVLAYDLYDGGFLPIGVGWGKTLVSLMIAERAHVKSIGMQRTLLLVPPQVYPQLVNYDIAWARRHVSLSMPITKLGNKSKARRLALAKSQRHGCYILPYSCLSTTDSEELLELIAPDLIIADEAHLLKNPRAARSARIKRYIDREGPEFVAMSGTVTSRSITDYWWLIKAALGENCPLPLSGHLVRQWSGVLDSTPITPGWDQGEPDFHTEPIMPLVRWAKRNWPGTEFPETTRGFREAYKKRLMTAPGVVVTGDSEIGTGLLLANQPAPAERPGWAQLQEHERAVREDWKAPNGDEIDHAMHAYKWLYELSAGFYNDLYWPSAEDYAEEKNISVDLAADLLERAQWHHTLRQGYHCALRRWLTSRSRPGLDTPFLVGGDMATNGAKNVGADLYETWRTMKEAEFEGMPKRRSRPIRVCDYKIEHAATWALTQEPGDILWYHHQEIGRWLLEKIPDALHCPAGKNNEILAVGDPSAGGRGDRIVIASIPAHGLGKNLQAFEHQYMVQWPRSAVAAEQMLGRTHRNGQKADELVIHMNGTTQLDEDNFAACLNDSAYIHQTTGVRQKMMFANYDPIPKVLSSKLLRQRGLSNKILTGEQIRLLQDKFGDF